MIDGINNGNSNVHQFDESVGLRYIFGEMSESEQERFEEAYFEDDAFFERFLAVKNELIDLYTRDELEPQIRTRMERTFLKTFPRRKRIEESRAFTLAITTIADRDALATDQGEKRASDGQSWSELVGGYFTFPRLAAFAGILLCLLGAFWLVNKRSSDGVADLTVQPPQANSTQQNEGVVLSFIPDNSNATLTTGNDAGQRESNTLLSQDGTGNSVVVPDRSHELESKAPSTPKSSLIARESPNDPVIILRKNSNQNVDALNETESITLDESTRSITRGNTAEIGTTTKTVRIRLLFSGQPYSSYSVRLETVEGATAWQALRLKAAVKNGPKSLSILVPAKLLSGKDYIIALVGNTTNGRSETIREYYLHVERPG